MSRIGKLPVALTGGVSAELLPGNTGVSLKKGNQSLTIQIHPDISVEISSSQVVLKRKNEEKRTKAFHGLHRALIQNAAVGLNKGWSKSLRLNGVGYKAVVSGKRLEMNLGYSHPIFFDIPQDIDIKVNQQTELNISGADRQKVGQWAAKIRNLRPPEPYLGKGVRYKDEVIKKKSGKSGAEKK